MTPCTRMTFTYESLQHDPDWASSVLCEALGETDQSSSLSINTPLGVTALAFPLFRHAPSVYMLISGVLGLAPCPWRRPAGMLVTRSGFVNMRKHSARSFLQVIDGSKRIAPCVAFAVSFAAFLLLVSEMFPCPSLCSGFSLGSIRLSLSRASWAQACGVLQPSRLSLTQSRHMQVRLGWLTPASRRTGSAGITCVSSGLTGGTESRFIDGELGMW